MTYYWILLFFAEHPPLFYLKFLQVPMTHTLRESPALRFGIVLSCCVRKPWACWRIGWRWSYVVSNEIILKARFGYDIYIHVCWPHLFHSHSLKACAELCSDFNEMVDSWVIHWDMLRTHSIHWLWLKLGELMFQFQHGGTVGAGKCACQHVSLIVQVQQARKLPQKNTVLHLWMHVWPGFVSFILIFYIVA